MEVTLDLHEALFWVAVVGGPFLYLLVGAVFTGLVARLSPTLKACDVDAKLFLMTLWPLVIAGSMCVSLVACLVIPFIHVYRFVSGDWK